MKIVLIALVKLYQLTLSPFIGNCCRFYPSCSHYAIDAIQEKPLHKALFLIIKRLSKCHPFSKGGIDFIPK
jgi:putative membrane protein insertion efficiency factor